MGLNSSKPIRNMRITFWGVQGSCPIFPTEAEIRDYARRVALYTLERAMADQAHRAASIDPAAGGAEVMRRLLSHPSAAEYQKRIGLPDLPVYGGDTSCIEVETSDGDVLVFDLGTGVRDFSTRLLQKWANRQDRTLYVFGSHQHLDHRMGLPFAGFCFSKPNPFQIRMFGPPLFLRALDQRYGIFSRRVHSAMHLDDPLDYRLMSATFTGVELRPGKPNVREGTARRRPWAIQDADDVIQVGATSIQAFPVYHGKTQCLGYKVSHGGSSFVYCTDHEVRHGSDSSDPLQTQSEAAEAEVTRQCMNVDAAYFDGQYHLSEYLGDVGIAASPAVSRVDWGHSCVEDVVARARRCNIARTFIGHHDPERPWQERVSLDRDLILSPQPPGVRIELAKAGAVIDV